MEASMQKTLRQLVQPQVGQVKPKKHKRINRVRWDKAWNLVQFWYAHLAREGAVRYTVTGDEVSVSVPLEQGERDTLAQAKKDRPENWRTRRDKAGVEVLSADGKERRYILPQKAENGFWGVSTDPYLVVNPRNVQGDADEQFEWKIPLEPRIKYARRAMQTVAKLSPDAHRVLEMRAATWDFPAVAENIGCAEPTVRQYFSEGIGIVMLYQDLCKPGRSE